MLTAEGPRVLEFNARFGDPETQVILARMRSDLVPVLEGVADGAFDDTRLEWVKDAAACVVLAAQGYPGPPRTGDAVRGLDLLEDLRDVMAFHAATARHGDEVVTVGGRVLGITALAGTLDEAVARAYAAASLVSFEGMHYRRDIGHAALARLHGEA
jgi:phosphoribosylamine--glycine ligase